MSAWVRLTRNVHRRLARWFPHDFKVLHGDDLERLGDDAADYVWRRHGLRGLAGMLLDAAVRLAAEHLAGLGQDSRQAARRLRRSPGYATVGVLSIAFSVGMCSLFYNQLRTLTGPASGIGDPGTLVATERPVAYPYFEQYREQKGVVAAAAAFIGPTPFTVRVRGEQGERQRVFGHLVTPTYFTTLQAVPAAGRFFDPKREKPGSEITVVVSHRFWETQLESDPKAVGRTLEINGARAVIVGVAAEGFRGVYPLNPAEIYAPITAGAAIAPELRGDALEALDKRRFRPLFRLAQGVTMAEAEAALQVTTKVLDEQRPEAEREREASTLALLKAGVVNPVTDEARATIYGLNFVLLGMILAMACSNLTVLLLARGAERRKEVAIRLSVGAGRFRVVRQAVTESVLLALIGGAGGLMLAYWLLRLTGALQIQSAVPVELELHLGWESALFAMGLSALAGIGFGLAPALASVRGDLTPALKEGGQARLRGYGRLGMRNQFMAFQLAGSLSMLLLTGFVVWGYQRAYQVDPGFETNGVYLLALDPSRDGYSVEESAKLLEDLPERLSQAPGVRSAAMAMDLGFTQATVSPNVAVTVPGAPVKEDAEAERAAVNNVVRQRVGAGYFATLSIPILQGREIDARDQSSAEQSRPVPVVLNQTAAQRLFGAADPIGATLLEGERSCVVVGVARDIKSGLMMGAPAPTMFTPLSGADFGAPSLTGATVLLRALPGGAPLEGAKRELAALDPDLLVFHARSLDSELNQFNLMLRWSAAMNGSLGAFGLALSVIGLFGVTAHAVARRRKEIGIRVSLGAQRGHVLGLVLREGAALVFAGGAMGFAGAWLLSRVFSASASRLAEVFAVGTDDLRLVVGAPIAWALVAMLACWLPARKSLRIDPNMALRSE